MARRPGGPRYHVSVLLAEGISKHYGGVYALKGAHFALNAGEVHALMGENGAGKSTLARVIAGSTRADSGVIRIDGQVVPIASRTHGRQPVVPRSRARSLDGPRARPARFLISD